MEEMIQIIDNAMIVLFLIGFVVFYCFLYKKTNTKKGGK